MARNALAPPPADGARLRPPGPGVLRALVLLLIAPALAGCAAMERMDFWDQFFEPAPRPSLVRAMEPIAGPGDYPARPANPNHQQPAVIAMAPIAGPGDYAAPAEPSPRRPGVVAMAPIAGPGDYAPLPTPAPDRSAQTAGLRAADPRPSPAPPPAEAMDAEQRTRSLVRQNPWLTRFWMELTPAQQARVERHLLRANVRPAGGQSEPAAAWDPMGLADRAALVFGRGTPFERPEPAEERGRPTFAGNS